MVETTVTFLPTGEDGILKTFVERYTTMLVHDSILMEQLPAPHFMHQLNPKLLGTLKLDPRDPHRELSDSDSEVEYPSLEDILRQYQGLEFEFSKDEPHDTQDSEEFKLDLAKHQPIKTPGDDDFHLMTEAHQPFKKPGIDDI